MIQSIQISTQDHEKRDISRGDQEIWKVDRYLLSYLLTKQQLKDTNDDGQLSDC